VYKNQLWTRLPVVGSIAVLPISVSANALACALPLLLIGLVAGVSRMSWPLTMFSGVLPWPF
jgi:hypothetical protein